MRITMGEVSKDFGERDARKLMLGEALIDFMAACQRQGVSGFEDLSDSGFVS